MSFKLQTVSLAPHTALKLGNSFENNATNLTTVVVWFDSILDQYGNWLKSMESDNRWTDNDFVQ
jgi:hypothetical protein